VRFYGYTMFEAISGDVFLGGPSIILLDEL